MELLPWWIYLVIAGIVISGFMVIFTEKKEHEIDDEYIESEGNVYMERIKEAREKRFQHNGKDVRGVD